MTRKQVAAFIVAVSILLLAIQHGRQFRGKHNITIGYIRSVDGGGKGNWGPGVHYTYYANGRLVEDSRRVKEFPYTIGQIIVGKSFPVAYRKYWYGYEDCLLITPSDFTNYGREFPDSLQWVLDYIEK